MNVIIKSNGEITPAVPKNGTDFRLDELRAVVGGWIEVVYLQDKDKHFMVVNEEGKSLKLPYNAKATYIYQNHTGCNDVIVGDVLVCENDKIK